MVEAGWRAPAGREQEGSQTMPTYEYACTECGRHLEKFQSFSDEPLTVCPSCSGTLRKVFGSVGIVLKGSGFYKTDNRRSSSVGSGSSGGSSDSGGSGSSSTEPAGAAAKSSTSGDGPSGAAPAPASSAPASSGSGSSGSGKGSTATGS
jgi:putative FmdB family regulatory protein